MINCSRIAVTVNDGGAERRVDSAKISDALNTISSYISHLSGASNLHAARMPSVPVAEACGR